MRTGYKRLESSSKPVDIDHSTSSTVRRRGPGMLSFQDDDNDSLDDDAVNLLDPTPSYRTRSNRRCVIVLAVVCCAVGIALGVIIGWYGHKNSVGDDDGGGKTQPQISTDEQLKKGREFILQHLNKENIQKLLKEYTSKPRLAGSKFSLDLSDEMAQAWRDNGLDFVYTPTYDVLLSYPNKTSPNELEIIYQNGTSTGIKSAPFEKPLDPEGNNTDVVPPYNSFAPAGIVEGDLIYVNYGRIEDFQYLKNNISGMTLTGRIAIARYGKIYRGDKVKNAQRFGMLGMVMYTDPADFNIANSTVYPDSWWLPDTGLQRGTVGFDGDYLTPLYPATDYAHRKKKEDVLDIKIPAQPISYGDAVKFLQRMKGPKAPDDWQGTLPITYNLGPGFNDTNLKVRLTVNNYEVVSPVKNVIGFIKGTHEPDRYILMGNHHDAWVFGAVDPLSGAAVVTELTRVFGAMSKKGIRPRRTVVFCSWGDEEQGLVGSTEWVEEKMKLLYERGVAYINVDYAADYVHHLEVGVSPLLQDPLYNAAKQVPNPTPSEKYPTLYDVWLNRTKTDKNEPSVYYSLGSGSDMATFYQRAGVPSLDMWYTYDYDLWNILSYPVYHSAYETYRMYSKYIDPSFNYTLAMGQLSGALIWNLANEDVLSFDVRRYPAAIKTFIQSLEKQFSSLWTKHNVNQEALASASDNFTQAAEDFQKVLDAVDKTNPLACRVINDKMIQLERAFIDPEGLPNRPMYKHVMFAPSQFDTYSDNSFPGIVDTMYEIQYNNSSDWDLLKHQVYVATYIIQGAAETLQDIGL